HRGAAYARQRALATPRPGLHRRRRSPTLPTAPRPRSGGDAVGSLPSRRVLRRQRNTAREAGLERAGRGADRGAPRAQAQACGRRLHGARPPADSRGAPRHRGEHVRQGDQTWLGLARRDTRSGRARRRPDRGARPRRVLDAQQGRLRPRRPPAARPGAGPDGGQGLATLLAASASNSAPDVREPAPPAPVGAETGEPVAGPLERTKPAQPSPPETRLPVPRGPRRPARYGLSIKFEARPDDPELARLVESTVWVNETHPAYCRAVAARSEGYHIALATALALAPLSVEPAKEHAFIIAFLTSWGAALGRRKGGRRR